MPRILALHGPNLNLLGRREPGIYGAKSLPQIVEQLKTLAQELGHDLESFQSNHEGALVDALQAAPDHYEAILFNPAAYTHTSVAIRDAVLAIRDQVIVIELHLSLTHARETFRHHSYLADVVHGRVEGFGPLSYMLALRAASALIAGRGENRDQ